MDCAWPPRVAQPRLPNERMSSACVFLLLAVACVGRQSNRAPEVPAPLVLGRFVDDYGNRYEISDRTWLQLPGARYHVRVWKPAEQYLVAQNDSANRGDPGRWTRIDWLRLTDMAPYTWAFCMSAYNAPTREAAAAAAVARRETPRTGCNGFPFSRMRPDTVHGPGGR
jgi:hypothetical protein